MIFVTVGTQLPFDRLIGMVEQWAKTSGEEVVAQIGESEFESDIITCIEHLKPNEFTEYIKSCRLIVSHAGMGTILTALQFEKPLVIFPRRAEFKEHRNDHQLATFKSFRDKNGVYAVETAEELESVLNLPYLTSGKLEVSTEFSVLRHYISTFLE
jgi:UDP-N-acetylglucosamine transferase subunit ALG13